MRRSKCLVTLMILVMFAMSGCDKSGTSREEFAAGNLNSESLLGEAEDLNVMNDLLGDINAKQLFTFLGTSLDTLDVLAQEGYTSKDDYNTLRNILVNIYGALKQEQAEYEANPESVGSEDTAVGEASQAIGQLLDLAAENQVGTLLYQVFSRINSDGLLTEDLYPMLDYVMAVDPDILKDLGGGIGIGNITDDQQEAITFLFNDARTGALNTQFKALKTALDGCKGGSSSSELDLKETLYNLAGDRTVGDVKALLDPDQAAGNPLVAVLLASLDVMLDLAADDKTGGFQDDVQSLMGHTGGLLFNYSQPLLGLLYAPLASNYSTDAKQAAFETFVLNALGGLAPTTDDAGMDGLLKALAVVDPSQAAGMANGVNYLFSRNMYGRQIRNAFGTYVVTEKDTDLYGDAMVVKQSWLRSLCFLMKGADCQPNLLGISVLKMMGSTDELDAKATQQANLSVWTVGEIVSALRAAEAYNAAKNQTTIYNASIKVADYDNNHVITPYEAFNWVMYSKDYNVSLSLSALSTSNPTTTLQKLANKFVDFMTSVFPTLSKTSLTLMKFKGLVGMMNGTMDVMAGTVIPHSVFDSFASLVYLGGGDINMQEIADLSALKKINMTDPLWSANRGTGGKNHKVFAIFGPLMKLFYENGSTPAEQEASTLKMVHMLSGLNEITSDTLGDISASKAWFGGKTKSQVFGSDEVGGILKGFEPFMCALTNQGVVTPLLDITFTTLNSLNTTAYDGTTVLAALLGELDLGDGLSQKSKTQLEEMANNLCKDGGPVDDVRAAMSDPTRFTNMVSASTTAGQILLTLASDDYFDQIAELMSMGKDFDFDISWGAYDDLVNYLLEDVNGVPNPFISKSRKFGYRLLDLQDDNYNSEGAITDSWKLTDALDHLVVWPIKNPAFTDYSTTPDQEPWIHEEGDTGLYSPECFMNFTDELNVKYPDLLKNAAADGGAVLDKVMGDESMSFSFLQALFTEVDITGDGKPDDSVVLATLRLVHPEVLDSPDVMNELLVEIGGLVSGVELKANSNAFQQLLKMMEFLVNSTTVK